MGWTPWEPSRASQTLGNPPRPPPERLSELKFTLADQLEVAQGEVEKKMVNDREND